MPRALHVVARMLFLALALLGLASVIFVTAPPGSEVANSATSARAPADQAAQFMTHGHGGVASAAYLLLAVMLTALILTSSINHKAWQVLARWKNGADTGIRHLFATIGRPVRHLAAWTRLVRRGDAPNATLSFWPGAAGGLGSHLGKYGVPHPC